MVGSTPTPRSARAWLARVQSKEAKDSLLREVFRLLELRRDEARSLLFKHLGRHLVEVSAKGGPERLNPLVEILWSALGLDDHAEPCHGVVDPARRRDDVAELFLRSQLRNLFSLDRCCCIRKKRRYIPSRIRAPLQLAQRARDARRARRRWRTQLGSRPTQRC